jgi:hypothetical protein
MKSIYYLLPLLLFSFSSIHAQKNYYVKAIVVKNNGDTLTGYVERLRDNLLSVSVNFKTDASANSKQEFSPNDLQSFTLLDYNLKYEPVIYTHTVKSNSVTEKRFALLLLDGYCSLYFLELKDDEVNIIFDQLNSHVFLAKKDGTFTVLSETESMDGNSYKLDKDYMGTIKTLFSDCLAITDDMVKRTGFYKQSMLHIFTVYNNCRQPRVPTKQYSTSQKLKIQTALYVGYSAFSYKHVSNSSGFSTGFFIDLTNPEANERLSFSAGFNYTGLKFNFLDPFSHTNEKTRVNIYGLQLKAMYYLSKGKIKPFISAGVVPALVTFDTLAETGYSNTDKGQFLLGSFGPGITAGKLYADFVIERDGIFVANRGTYFTLRIGVFF